MDLFDRRRIKNRVEEEEEIDGISSHVTSVKEHARKHSTIVRKKTIK